MTFGKEKHKGLVIKTWVPFFFFKTIITKNEGGHFAFISIYLNVLLIKAKSFLATSLLFALRNPPPRQQEVKVTQIFEELKL